ncbi:MAG: outer membrane lipid asymmetry maintenance protein MlaD [Thermodesulfobacteriota bacterium]
MRQHSLEVIVGIFVVIGIAAMAYIAVSFGNIGFLDNNTYHVRADFDSTEGLRSGARVEIAGVAIGSVGEIDLRDYLSSVELKINNGVKIPDDSIAAVRTNGLIGEKIIKIVPGGSEESLGEGDTIEDTESSVSIEELISKYIFSEKE